jgi:hypothetical protein
MAWVMPVRKVIDGGVHQRGERAEALAAAQLHRPDLGDPVVRRRAAGRLDVDDDEGDVAQRGPEVVERSLHPRMVVEQVFDYKAR